MQKIFLINISGADRPGLTSSLMDGLAAHEVRVLDIGQAVVHENLALAILIELASEDAFASLKKELLVRAHDLELKIQFTSVSRQAFEHWVRSQGKFRFIVTILGRHIAAAQLARTSASISRHGLNIDRIERLSGRTSLVGSSKSSKACIEFEISGSGDTSNALRAELMQLTHEFDVDIAFQRESIYRRNRRLVVFDMDSTLIAAEIIDELAKLHG